MGSAGSVYKKNDDESLRLYIDFRELNKVKIRNQHPFTRIDDLFLSITGNEGIFENGSKLRLPSIKD